jgi:2-methylisocitrate lyase-like PEP mutase family enzyme
VALKTTDEFLAALRLSGNQRGWLERMQTRKELYELLEYDPAAEIWDGFHA